MSRIAMSVAFVLSTTYAVAQEPQVLQTFPFAASKAVASEHTVSPYDDLIFAGAGGGIYVLEGANASDPQPWTETSNTMLRVGGFTREICVTEDHVYVAAGIGGLTRFDRNSDPPLDRDIFKFDAVADAWALDVVDVAGTDWVFVGTNDGATGTIRLLEIDDTVSPPAITEQNSWEDLAPVWTLEASTAIESGEITLLVGTACSANGALLRYDIPIANLPNVPAMPADQWSANGQATFIRDIVIDEDAIPPRAFVAAYTAGTHRFTLDGGLLNEVAGPGWPIIAPGAGGVGPFFHVSLALHPDADYLVIAGGAPLSGDVQHFGTCSIPSSCANPEEGEHATSPGLGLSAWTGLSATGTAPILMGCLQVFDKDTTPVGAPVLPKPPVSVAIRARVEEQFLIDVGCDAGGFVVVSATDNLQGNCGLRWQLDPTGTWDKDDGNPTSSIDDVLAMNGVLYTGSEVALQAYDLAVAEADLLADLASQNADQNAILLVGADGSDGEAPRLYAPRLDAGVAIFDVAGANALAPVEGLGARSPPMAARTRRARCRASTADAGSTSSTSRTTRPRGRATPIPATRAMAASGSSAWTARSTSQATSRCCSGAGIRRSASSMPPSTATSSTASSCRVARGTPSSSRTDRATRRPAAGSWSSRRHSMARPGPWISRSSTRSSSARRPSTCRSRGSRTIPRAVCSTPASGARGSACSTCPTRSCRPWSGA